MKQNNKLKQLLIEWQNYEHHGDYDESEKIANQIKKYYNIDMNNENECDIILYKYHLIKGWEEYAE